MGMNIIDRRKNPKAKSLVNRRRFMERIKDSIKDSAKRAIGKRSISDEGETKVKVKGVKEDKFRHDAQTGNQDYVVTGNKAKKYRVGDPIEKQGGGSGGRGNEGSNDGEGEDDFAFSISYDEYLDVLFEGLELPNLVKESNKNSLTMVSQRSGFTNRGVAANLDVGRTMLSGRGRRIALKAPKLRRIEELAEEFLTADETRKVEIQEEIARLKRRAGAVAFLDDIDLRYRNFEMVKKPVTQAVMICVMDVSFSMGEEHKTIAKKMFLLINLFLRRQYRNVEVVFIRHHIRADECDETTFFTSRDGGGTVVSSAYEKTLEIIKARYPGDDWNIYLGQVSDGDNYEADHHDCVAYMNEIMNLVQFAMYMEVRPSSSTWNPTGVTNLWTDLKEVEQSHPDRMLLTSITDEAEIVPVFRSLFTKKD